MSCLPFEGVLAFYRLLIQLHSHALFALPFDLLFEKVLACLVLGGYKVLSC